MGGCEFRSGLSAGLADRIDSKSTPSVRSEGDSMSIDSKGEVTPTVNKLIRVTV